jgi:hypothetical protein
VILRLVNAGQTTHIDLNRIICRVLGGETSIGRTENGTSDAEAGSYDGNGSNISHITSN